jgi:dTDP-4-dehydrorhamnose 3,5-epimerase
MSEPAVTPLSIAGLLLIVPRIVGDARGEFVETYHRAAYGRLGVAADFSEEKQFLSRRRGTVRGLHFQHPPFAQAKLIRVLVGAVFDVAVDLRRSSPTYGRSCSATLTAAGAEQLFIPRGFAHGYATLADDTIVAYKVDAPYAPGHEGGVAWDDPDLAISWPVARDAAVLSERDLKLPRLCALVSPFE